MVQVDCFGCDIVRSQFGLDLLAVLSGLEYLIGAHILDAVSGPSPLGFLNLCQLHCVSKSVAQKVTSHYQYAYLPTRLSLMQYHTSRCLIHIKAVSISDNRKTEGRYYLTNSGYWSQRS